VTEISGNIGSTFTIGRENRRVIAHEKPLPANLVRALPRMTQQA
jgi:hypothetical protein